MIPLSRRGFVVGAATASIAIGVDAAAAPAPAQGTVLMFDATLAAGARFAARAHALGSPARPIDGDRVRLIRAILDARPAAIFGVSRHADALLVADVAGETGYRRLSLIQHRGEGVLVSGCPAGASPLGTLARLAGARWPEAFAELATGGLGQCGPVHLDGPGDPAFSWVVSRR